MTTPPASAPSSSPPYYSCRWMTGGPWLLGANLHDGAVVASYPWDHYTDPAQKTGPHATPDNAVFQRLAATYAENNPAMSNSSACLKYAWLEPTTNGAAWYPKNGTMKDFGYRETGSLDLVLELACCKFLPSYFLPREWDHNRWARCLHIHGMELCLLFQLEELAPYGWFFSTSCGGLQPSAATVGPSGPIIRPFGPT